MEETSLLVKIVIAAIVLHLVFGFGWLVYKLAPRKGDVPPQRDDGAD